MNLTCPECKTTIFTPSNDTDEHKRLLDGHMAAIHGDIKVRMTKLLNRCLAALSIVQAHGGIKRVDNGKETVVFSKFDALHLADDIKDVLQIPRQATEVPPPVSAPSAPSGGLPPVPQSSTPDESTVKLFNSGNKGKPLSEINRKNIREVAARQRQLKKTTAETPTTAEAPTTGETEENENQSNPS